MTQKHLEIGGVVYPAMDQSNRPEPSAGVAVTRGLRNRIRGGGPIPASSRLHPMEALFVPGGSCSRRARPGC
jgi:hypothetical protein